MDVLGGVGFPLQHIPHLIQLPHLPLPHLLQAPLPNTPKRLIRCLHMRKLRQRKSNIRQRKHQLILRIYLHLLNLNFIESSSLFFLSGDHFEISNSFIVNNFMETFKFIITVLHGEEDLCLQKTIHLFCGWRTVLVSV